MTPRSLAIPPDGFHRIAVLRLSSLGDVILSLPVVQALKRAFPQSRLSYWVKEEYADAVRFDPAVDHVRSLERDGRKTEDLLSMSSELEECDLIVDLHGSLRTRLLTFRQKAAILRAPSYRLLRERWVRARWSKPKAVPHAAERYAAALDPIGVRADAEPKVTVPREAETWASNFQTQWNAGRPALALCPGSRHFTKRWPEEHWLAFDERVAKRGTPRLYFSLAQEKRDFPRLVERVEKDPMARWCSEPLPRMAALITWCTGAVTSDSGLMHLAAARGVRTVALFGSTAPELGFTPVGKGHVVLSRHEPCQPCTLHGRPTCPLTHFRCMREITPEQVEQAMGGKAAERLVVPGTRG